MIINTERRETNLRRLKSIFYKLTYEGRSLHNLFQTSQFSEGAVIYEEHK